MAHTYSSGGTSFIFNSDLSGEVIIQRAGEIGKLAVPAKDLLSFAAEIVRRKRIGSLEDQSDAEVLGLPDFPQ